MTRDITWTIDGITADGLQTPTTPTFTRGTTITSEFLFRRIVSRSTSVDYTGGFSYGAEGSSYGSIQYSASSRTTTTTTVTQDYSATYYEILNYLEYSGEDLVRYGTTDRGKPWFRERIPDDAPVNSLVVPVEPGDDIVDVSGHWGIILGGTDQSEPPGSSRSVELEILILAPLDEYADRDAVYADLGSEVI